jgi:methylated-DNA-[protein]-cysteine S-methyltransferase
MTMVRSMSSPLGNLLLAGDGETIRGLSFPDHRPPPLLDAPVPDPHAFEEAVRQLGEWFSGARTRFDLKLDLRGTDFQLRVWDALTRIPFGRTLSYRDIAAAAGLPGAARAAGHAVARNPVSIVVPCHRVVGADGSLTGYAGGMERKRALLEHERGVGLLAGSQTQ